MGYYVEIDLGNGRMVDIQESRGESEYRYDIYENGMIVGAMGMGVIIDDKDKLNHIVDSYLSQVGRF